MTSKQVTELAQNCIDRLDNLRIVEARERYENQQYNLWKIKANPPLWMFWKAPMFTNKKPWSQEVHCDLLKLYLTHNGNYYSDAYTSTYNKELSYASLAFDLHRQVTNKAYKLIEACKLCKTVNLSFSDYKELSENYY